jgi:hypothetical protein
VLVHEPVLPWLAAWHGRRGVASCGWTGSGLVSWRVPTSIRAVRRPARGSGRGCASAGRAWAARDGQPRQAPMPPRRQSPGVHAASASVASGPPIGQKRHLSSKRIGLTEGVGRRDSVRTNDLANDGPQCPPVTPAAGRTPRASGRAPARRQHDSGVFRQHARSPRFLLLNADGHPFWGTTCRPPRSAAAQQPSWVVGARHSHATRRAADGCYCRGRRMEWGGLPRVRAAGWCWPS